MNHLYQKTFDQISMPEDRARSLRQELASHCSHAETEVHSMNNHKVLRRPAAFLAAVILIAALSFSALACGGYVIYQTQSSDAKLPEGSTVIELSEEDFETAIPYTYTEEDGEILVSFDANDQEAAE